MGTHRVYCTHNSTSECMASGRRHPRTTPYHSCGINRRNILRDRGFFPRVRCSSFIGRTSESADLARRELLPCSSILRSSRLALQTQACESGRRLHLLVRFASVGALNFVGGELNFVGWVLARCFSCFTALYVSGYLWYPEHAQESSIPDIKALLRRRDYG